MLRSFLIGIVSINYTSHLRVSARLGASTMEVFVSFQGLASFFLTSRVERQHLPQ